MEVALHSLVRDWEHRPRQQLQQHLALSTSNSILGNSAPSLQMQLMGTAIASGKPLGLEGQMHGAHHGPGEMAPFDKTLRCQQERSRTRSPSRVPRTSEGL
mmetsp:Transcript_19091/g.41156  ORF Transcript_19091/g.41156 Transcript_19091/m.41156 type:complete len:101 (-) Transcript_19091:7-309(-)